MSSDGYQSQASRANGMAAAGRSHTGKVRSVNQDTFVCAPEQGLFAVVDGMGGARAGEIAADLTRRALLDNRDALTTALNRANEAVFRRAARRPDERGMGCVATVARVEGPDLVIAHVGDTRALLASRTGCEQLTRDHTVVADVQEERGYTEEQADQLEGRHQVTRDIGGRLHEDDSWIDHARTHFEVGDLLLLCSDGLSDLVNDGELFSLLGRARREGRDVEELADQLIELALTRGAHDNVTVVAVRREELVDFAPPSEEEVPLDAPNVGEVVIKSAPAGSDTTEMIPKSIVMGPSTRQGSSKRIFATGARALAGLFLVVAVAYALVSLRGRWSVGLIGKSGIVAAGSRGDRILAVGPAGLDGTLERDVKLTALGRLDVATPQTRTHVAGGVDAVIHAARFRFPDDPEATWEIRVGDGARLKFRQVSIRAPGLRVGIAFEGETGTVIFEDCHLDLRALEAQGPEEAQVGISGGALHLRTGRRGLRMDGPRFTGTIHTDPPIYRPAEEPPPEEGAPPDEEEPL